MTTVPQPIGRVHEPKPADREPVRRNTSQQNTSQPDPLAVPPRHARAARRPAHAEPRRAPAPAASRQHKIRATCEADIIRAVTCARDAGSRVRAIGSGGSKNGNYETAGRQLHLGAYDALIALDGNRVTVQAGMTVARLQAILEHHGLALPTPGEWNGATVAGAISTGTHGGSSRHGCFATSLVAIRLVTGTGTCRILQRGSPDFRHAGVSLGLMGIVSEITFECVERFHLTLERRLVPFEHFLIDHDRAIREHEYFSAVWFPAADRVLTFTADRCIAPRRGVRRAERYGLTAAALSAFPGWRRVSDSIARVALHQVATGSSAEILSPIGTTGRRVQWLRRLAPRLREVEFAIPLERGAAALIALENLLHEWPGMLTLPIGIRATAGDGFSLSPCFGRDVLWISTFYRENEQFTAALADLFARFDARCHWGKTIALTPAQLWRQYPNGEAFAAARARFDPDRVFQNTFTEEYIR